MAATDIRTANVVIATCNAEGDPDFYCCKVRCREEQYEGCAHHDAACDLATDGGFEGGMLVYDEVSGPKWLFDHFKWADAQVVDISEDDYSEEDSELECA